jgi:hypothetical protein
VFANKLEYIPAGMAFGLFGSTLVFSLSAIAALPRHFHELLPLNLLRLRVLRFFDLFRAFLSQFLHRVFVPD